MIEKTKLIPIEYNDLSFIVEINLSRDHNRRSYDEPPAPVEMDMLTITLAGFEVQDVLSEEVKAIIQSEAEGFASWD